MKHLDDAALAIIKSVCPPDSFLVIIVANKVGTSIDTDIQKEKVIPFLEETLEEMRKGQSDVHHS